MMSVVSSFGERTIQDGVTYLIDTKDKTVECIGFRDKDSLHEVLFIPDSICLSGQYYRVVSVADSAFADCYSLVSVSLGNCIETIGSFAFDDCRELRSINMSHALREIGFSAFGNCVSLESVSLPDGVKVLRERAFDGCLSLKAMYIPESVSMIGVPLFPNNNLNTIKVNRRNPVYDSRRGCNAIIETSTNRLIATCSNTTIPRDVVEIAAFSFLETNNLKRVFIPKNVAVIQNRAFMGCDDVEEIKVSRRNRTFVSEGNAIIASAQRLLVVGCKNTIIQSGIQSIGCAAFAGLHSLHSLTLPESVDTILWQAFADCTNLEEIIMPQKMHYMGDATFMGCNSLVSFVCPDGIDCIWNQVFAECGSLQSVILPKSVWIVTYRAFAFCTDLKEIEMPGVTRIHNEAFLDCSSLKKVTMSPDVVPDKDAFKGVILWK